MWAATNNNHNEPSAAGMSPAGVVAKKESFPFVVLLRWGEFHLSKGSESGPINHDARESLPLRVRGSRKQWSWDLRTLLARLTGSFCCICRRPRHEQGDKFKIGNSKMGNLSQASQNKKSKVPSASIRKLFSRSIEVWVWGAY